MLLTVGRIVRPHGVRGEVVVELLTDEPERRYVIGAELVVEPIREAVPSVLTVASRRPHQGRYLVTFEELPDRTAAERVRGLLLQVDRDQIPTPEDPDEFLDHQLVGLVAVTPDGEPLGEITAVEHAPASELLLLARPDGRTAMVPFVKAIVPAVDLAAGRVVVDPPAGLLDL